MPIEPPPDSAAMPFSLSRLAINEMMDQSLDLFRILLSNARLSALDIFTIKGGAPLHRRVLEAAPSLTETLRHVSIASHWTTTLGATLVDLVASCENLATLTLTGIDFAQVVALVATVRSRLVTFDFTVARSVEWTDGEARDAVDRFLALPSLESAREITATQRLDAKSGVSPSRLEEIRGRRCKFVWERTLRKSLSLSLAGGCGTPESAPDLRLLPLSSVGIIRATGRALP